VHIRSTVLDTDPALVDGGIALVRERLLPLVDGLDHSLGASMLVNRPTGRTITSTMWGTRSALESSAEVMDELRAEAALQLGGVPLVEQWELAELYRSRRPEPGFATRSTRLEYDPADAEQLVDVFRTTAVPALALIDGFASAALLIDLDRGKGVTLVTFTDRRAMEDSRRASAEIRRTTVDKAHALATEVVEADLVVSHLHVPDQA
jgi:hypothetical protein